MTKVCPWSNLQLMTRQLLSLSHEYMSACWLEAYHPEVVDWLLVGRIPEGIRHTLLTVSAVRHGTERPRRLRLVVNR